MIINLAAAARLVPLSALMLGACVSQSALEQQGPELQAARAQAEGGFDAPGPHCPDGRGL